MITWNYDKPMCMIVQNDVLFCANVCIMVIMKWWCNIKLAWICMIS